MVSQKNLTQNFKNTQVTGILTGPTATGKTTLALELVQLNPQIEIVNADSLLVYKSMDIGTAKPSQQELKKVPHHLINIRYPNENFTAGDFVRGVEESIQDIESRGKQALIVGGTGFYLKALLYGLWEGSKSDPKLRAQLEERSSRDLYEELLQADQETALRIGVNDRYRLLRSVEIIKLTNKTPSQLQKETEAKGSTIQPRYRLWVIDRPEEETLRRIETRAQAMLEGGFVDEVKAVRAQYPGARALMAVGYAQVCNYLDGVQPEGRKLKPGLEGLYDEIVLATRQLLKKQRTWFRGQKGGTWYILDQDREKLTQAFREIYVQKK